MNWKSGDRFSYVRMCGGWGNGTVLEVNGDRVVGRLDCQKEGETYQFHASNPNFIKGEMTHDRP